MVDRELGQRTFAHIVDTAATHRLASQPGLASREYTLTKMLEQLITSFNSSSATGRFLQVVNDLQLCQALLGKTQVSKSNRTCKS